MAERKPRADKTPAAVRKTAPRRFRSVRAYRRVADAALAEAYRGERPVEEAKKIADAARAGAELLMAEQLLSRQAGGDAEPAGGEPEAVGPAGRFRVRKVRHRTGRNDRHGAYDERRVEVEVGEGPASASDAEADADVEALS